MRPLDHEGLVLCKLQGEIFRASLDHASCSSPVFVRRFMNSRVARRMDSNRFLGESDGVESIFQEIDEEYGPSTYGSIHYGAETLYWMGYLYRYWSYRYGTSSRSVYKIIGASKLSKLFPSYHSLDPDQAIERLLEAEGKEEPEDTVARGVATLRELRSSGRFEYAVISLKDNR